MKKPETKLVENILKAIHKKWGGFWVKIHGGPFQARGLPDLMGCLKGRFCGFEVKMPGEEHSFTPIQEYRVKQIQKAGGIAGMVTSFEELDKILQDSLYK